MDSLSALGTGHFSQLLASALDVGDKPATEEAAKGSHSPSSGHLANDVDVVSKQQSSVERMKTAVHSHLSSQLSSDFIEGLRPVINSGKLHIATYIPLQGEEEPAFIGNYSSIQAAVQAQRQTHALVGRLPGPLAKKLIHAQLANALSAPHAVVAAAGDSLPGPGTDTAVALDKDPEGPADATTAADKASYGPGSGTGSAAAVATEGLDSQKTTTTVASTPIQLQQQHADLPQATAGEAGAAQAGTALAPSAEETTAATAAAAAAAGGPGVPAEAAAVKAEEVVAAKADGDAATVPAAEDTGTAAMPPMTTSAATTADAQPAVTSAALVVTGNDAAASLAATAAGSASGSAAAAAAQPLSALTDDVINLLLRKGLNALSAVAQTRESENGEWPQQQQQQQHLDEAAAGQLPNQETPLSATAVSGANGNSNTHAQGHYMPAAGAEGGLTAADFQHYQQQLQAYGSALSYGTDMPGGLPNRPSPAAAAASGGAEGAGAMEGMLEYAAPHTGQQRGSTGGHLPPRPALNEPWGAPGMQAGGAEAVAAGFGGYAAFPPGAYPAGAFPQDPYNMAQGADMFGRRPRTSNTASDTGFGGYSRDWSDYGSGMYGGAAAAQPTGSGDKRKRSDPRLNCIKSVQYRVSRFPTELHDMCVEHWERTRCARVVCNSVNGVMSVQGGRCVVSFTQHGQEVLKGVADYLRYAGEDRIKKWRRHVRMVDFPRPNNRTGELMTAEEFLCIVGYQSEQGGGKRPKYMSGAGGDTAADVSD